MNYHDALAALQTLDSAEALYVEVSDRGDFSAEGVATLNARFDALISAETTVNEATKAMEAQWAALPEGPAKDSAEINANETEGCGRRLPWLAVALSTFRDYEA